MSRVVVVVGHYSPIGINYDQWFGRVGGKGGVGERQLKGFLKLWLWGLMTKYKVNNSYHPCFLPPLPQKGAPMSK